jgi:hypothetical protein
MCVGFGALGAIASIGSSLLGGLGALQQASAASAQANYAAKVAEVNKQTSLYAADDARKRGAAAEEQQRLKTKQLAGRQRAVLAANGVELSSGSPLDVLTDTASVGELDALTVRGNANREALGYEAQARNYGYDANLDRMRAQAAATAGPISAAGTLIGGLGSVADKWYRMG